ncbi:M23 family metallopeptidase [bacterium]|nr:M23 family metallopeptidase [bacterium]
MKKFLVVIFSLFVFMSCAAPFGVYHKVKKNETLYSIAKLYGTTVDNLEKNNNIADAKKIMPGDYIFVPGVAAPLEAGGKAAVAPSNAKKEVHKDVKADKPAGKPAPKAAKPGKPSQYIWPVKGVVTSKFGARWGKKHSGIDIGCPEGTPIYAAADGKVVFSGEKSGYGLTIIILHPDNSFTIYAHNSKNLVSEQKQVKKGEKIALVGQTGKATGPHLHFEIRKGSEPVDPLENLPKTVP